MRLTGVVLGTVCGCGRMGFDAQPATSDGAAGGGSAYTDLILAAGPAAYWRLGEAVPSVAFDRGPSALHGTFAASAALGVPGALTGDPDTSVQFSGTTTGVAIADVFGFAGTAPYSLEAWVKPVVIDSQSRAFCGKKTLTDDGYSFFINTTGTGFGRYDATLKSEIYAPPLALGVFSHIVGTFDGATLIVYVNGAVAGTMINTTNLPPHSTGFAIGAKGDGTPGFFKGSIDEVAVYERALSGAEVAAHFTAGTR